MHPELIEHIIGSIHKGNTDRMVETSVFSAHVVRVHAVDEVVLVSSIHNLLALLNYHPVPQKKKREASY